mmetsp:Transcript_2914/g.7130  ORF Transcript_2914/g.7130 Transcript_2914/m.7130 type:complete len:245 (-) Transcript_2914:35-769(-)
MRPVSGLEHSDHRVGVRLVLVRECALPALVRIEVESHEHGLECVLGHAANLHGEHEADGVRVHVQVELRVGPARRWLGRPDNLVLVIPVGAPRVPELPCCHLPLVQWRKRPAVAGATRHGRRLVHVHEEHQLNVDRLGCRHDNLLAAGGRHADLCRAEVCQFQPRCALGAGHCLHVGAAARSRTTTALTRAGVAAASSRAAGVARARAAGLANIRPGGARAGATGLTSARAAATGPTGATGTHA